MVNEDDNEDNSGDDGDDHLLRPANARPYNETLHLRYLLICMFLSPFS